MLRGRICLPRTVTAVLPDERVTGRARASPGARGGERAVEPGGEVDGIGVRLAAEMTAGDLAGDLVVADRGNVADELPLALSAT